MRTQRRLLHKYELSILILLILCNTSCQLEPDSKQPEITIVTPNGGEEHKMGRETHIAWQDFGVSDYVRIDLNKNGETWVNIVDSALNRHFYSWIPPDSLSHSSQYTIRIEDNQDTSVYDLSDLPFTLFKSVTIADSELRSILINHLGNPIELNTLNLSELSTLYAADNGILSVEGIEHCINLKILDLPNNKISHMEPLSKMENIEGLNLSNNLIQNIPNLVSMNELKILDLSFNPVKSFDGLGQLIHIESLVLTQTNTEELSILVNLTTITELILNNNQIEDLSPVMHLHGLEKLRLDNNLIQTIDGLGSLNKLEYLSLSFNRIIDIDTLSGLSNINVLILSDNKIENIEPLAKNTGLGQGDMLIIYNNPLNSAAVDVIIPELIDRGVTVLF